MKDERMMFFVMSSGIHEYICIPLGSVVELGRENTSGHPGVTAIN